MTRLAKPLLLLVFPPMALWVIGCAPAEPASLSDARGARIVARVPDDAGLLPDAATRYPAGSSVVRVAADGSETRLSADLHAAGAPAVHHDAARILFVGQRSASEPFAVFQCNADGSELTTVVEHGSDCIRADFLPDGRIVYAAALPFASPLVGVPRGAALFVADGDGGAGKQITFGAGLDTDPAVLSDGRIVFASWRPGASHLGLFTVHPDGTGYAPFHLADGDTVLPRQDAGGDVRFTLLTAQGAQLLAASWDAPLSVVTMVPAEPGRALVPRRRPQGHLSALRADRPYGTVVCIDARANGAHAAASARLWTFTDARQLGSVQLAVDGSFMARVPVDTPLRLELVDTAGATVAAEHGPFWLRSNEVRVCGTCHDNVETGPPNVRPLAVLGEAEDLTGKEQ